MNGILLIVVIVLDVESDGLSGKSLKSIRLFSPISSPHRSPEYLQCYKGVLHLSFVNSYKGFA